MRCDDIHEADRILRAGSQLGVLCTPADGPMLTRDRHTMGEPGAVGTLYDEAYKRLGRPGCDGARWREAHRRLERARDDMLDPEKQREVREEWKREGWTRHVTSTLRCAIDANALEAYAERPEANVVPVDKHGVPYRGTEREMIQKLLGRASRQAGARWATVVVRYWYGHMGAALVDAGLVSTSREYAVPPDRDVDPFALPRRLRTLALGPFHDFDDAAAHPRARVQMVGPGSGVTKQFLSNREEILSSMGAALFQGEGQRERRARVKTLFASIDMDGNVATWAERWGLDKDKLKQTRVALEGGGSFDFGAYLQAQAEGTLWLSNSLEERTGMTRFVTDWLAHHKPGKGHPERTVKSFAFQEAESISRRAKVRWAARNGHAVLSLQHDGIVVAVKRGSDAGDVAEQMAGASEEALGYRQPCELKKSKSRRAE